MESTPPAAGAANLSEGRAPQVPHSFLPDHIRVQIYRKGALPKPLTQLLKRENWGKFGDLQSASLRLLWLTAALKGRGRAIMGCCRTVARFPSFRTKSHCSQACADSSKYGQITHFTEPSLQLHQLRLKQLSRLRLHLRQLKFAFIQFCQQGLLRQIILVRNTRLALQHAPGFAAFNCEQHHLP